MGGLLGEDGKSAVKEWAGKPSWVVNGRVPRDEWGYNFPGGGGDVYEFAAEHLMPPAYRFEDAPASVLYSFYAALQRFRTHEGVRPEWGFALQSAASAVTGIACTISETAAHSG